MKCASRVEYREVRGRHGVPRRVVVQRAPLPPIRMPLVNAVYVVTGGKRRVEREGFLPGPIAREVAHMLRGEPMRWPSELRSEV